MQAPTPVRNHPNASLAVGVGTPGSAIIWGLGHFGVSLSAEDGYYVAMGVITVGLAIGKRGLCGIVRLLMHGSNGS